MEIKVKKLHPDAKLPKFALPGDAGMDFFSVEKYEVEPGRAVSVRTGIALELPEGYVGLVWDKSGLSHKHQLKTLGGVSDSGYRGEIFIGIINLGKDKYVIEKGDKVAQMVIQRHESPVLVEVEELSTSVRGMRVFGSTGKQ